MSDYACLLLKCTNTRERTAQLETYAVLRHEKEESVYMRKTARERWRLKIGTQVAPLPSVLPSYQASAGLGSGVVKICSLAGSVHS